MKKVLAFAGSNSSKSINLKLALYTASLLKNVEIETLNLNDYQIPIYSIDDQLKLGFPDKTYSFLDRIKSVDYIVLSLAEHNGSYATAFKNIIDWASRADMNIFQQKPMILLAASPGGRGGASVLGAATSFFPFLGADIQASFSLPNFTENFDYDKGVVTNSKYIQELETIVANFQNKFE